MTHFKLAKVLKICYNYAPQILSKIPPFYSKNKVHYYTLKKSLVKQNF